jgi:fluoride exporter
VLLLAIWAGGMIGAWIRYHVTGWVYARAGTAFPWGTLAVNLAGSFVLGVTLPAMDLTSTPTPLGAFLVVGVIGAFTTFSTLAFETVMLLERRRRSRAAVYILASIGLGLVSLIAGLLAGSALR